MEQETFTKDQVIAAIETFLDYGEKTYNPKKEVGSKHGHGGYLSIGWAGRCLRFHLEQLKKESDGR